jgi:hypothetical protein
MQRETLGRRGGRLPLWASAVKCRYLTGVETGAGFSNRGETVRGGGSMLTKRDSCTIFGIASRPPAPQGRVPQLPRLVESIEICNGNVIYFLCLFVRYCTSERVFVSGLGLNPLQVTPL